MFVVFVLGRSSLSVAILVVVGASDMELPCCSWWVCAVVVGGRWWL